jgi:hypothetical protein
MKNAVLIGNLLTQGTMIFIENSVKTSDCTLFLFFIK